MESCPSQTLLFNGSVSSKLTTTPTTPSIETLVFDIFQQKAKDRELCHIEARRITEDLNRRIHDHKFAQEIDGIPDEVWDEFGEQYEKPFGEVGAAVCDPGDNLFKKVQKHLGGEWMNHQEVELKALIEGLNAAISLDTLNTQTQKAIRFISKVILLAHGGAGHILPTNTNPLIATGDRITMAHQAQVVISNMERKFLNACISVCGWASIATLRGITHLSRAP